MVQMCIVLGMAYFLISLLLLILPSWAYSDENVTQPQCMPEGITVDLREPEYNEGVLSTRSGGVITGPDLRIQAQNIIYTHKVVDGMQISTVVAEGDVRLDFYGYHFISRKLEYNFQEETGFVFDGRTSLFPWFFGGQMIQLCRDGSYIIYDGYVTTSENIEHEWDIKLSLAKLYPNKDLLAKNVKFYVGSFPVFWMPSLRTNLNTIFDIPIKYTLRWGGRQGSRVGMAYEVFSWGNLKTFLRLDYNIKRGPGGGFEIYYRDHECSEEFDSINYIAKDTSETNSNINTRYRFQGHYWRSWDRYGTIVDIAYDKLSDKDMATDYSDRGLELDIARRTHILVHTQQESWVGNLLVRPRLNSFQTINQELPTLSMTIKPWCIQKLGIVGGHYLKASYLDFCYAHGLPHVHDFTAMRIELRNYAFVPFNYRYFKVTPQVGTVSIFYGNTPGENRSWLNAGYFQLDSQTTMQKDYEWGRHFMRPYLSYLYFTYPTLAPNEHYIFDINDGIYRVNLVRLGVQHYLLQRYSDGSYCPNIYIDNYTWGFFQPCPSIPHIVPRIYTDVTFQHCDTLKNTIQAAWDFQHGGFAHLNFRSAWTVSDHLAAVLEYRQRNAFDWRKVNYENFALDFYRSQNELLFPPGSRKRPDASLSDRRKTLLLHIFYRMRYDMALEWESRLGWDRWTEPGYHEFNINLHVSLPASWRMKLAYQHKVCDDRIAIYFSMGLTQPPVCAPCTACTPCTLWQ